ncbi:ABC transporter permease [Rhodobacter sp. Har01]|uniref:ABC transporter permease n=1 Tax=Rhodobacter sp. Har01 TaxID=2883999 RepID=UPI001D08178A|nr:ABC transporter permease [Rhodobacter sp. Har01]MCB6179941.1 ABC transporter permease [Rhodobacter sp. Har01]
MQTSASAPADDRLLPRIGQWLSTTNLVVPAILVAWFAIVIVPIIILFVYSFFSTAQFRTVYEPSLDTWIGLFESGRWEVTLRTLRIAVTVTLIELVGAFPFALWLAKGGVSKGGRAVCLALLTIPFFLDMSSRTIVWRAILGQSGLVNTVLMGTGLTDAPVEWLLYSEVAVHFGMVVSLFPPMVLPIYMAINLIDDSLIEASKDLGASPWQTLRRVILPLSLPGVMAGVVFCLGPALAAWVEPGMLGGGFVNLISNSIESAYSALRYPVVAALSAFVILLLLVLLAAMYLIARRFGDPASSFRVLRG